MNSTLGPRPTFTHGREPSKAAVLSLLPGLGQLYNGEARKGILFLTVSGINFLALIFIMFAEPIVKALDGFGLAFHMVPNHVMGRTLSSGHFGSVLSFIFITFVLSFMGYAVRDAYDHAALRRRKIYPDAVLQLPEATSGSYIVHISIMVALALLCFFFVVPPPPKLQITDIEFVSEQQERSPARPETLRVAPTSSQRRGINNPRRPVTVSSQSAAHSPAQQSQPARTAQSTPARTQPNHSHSAASTSEPQAPRVVLQPRQPASLTNISVPQLQPQQLAMAPSTLPMLPVSRLNSAAGTSAPQIPAPGPRAVSAGPAPGLPALFPTSIARSAVGSGAPATVSRPVGASGLPNMTPASFPGSQSGPVGVATAPRAAAAPPGLTGPQGPGSPQTGPSTASPSGPAPAPSPSNSGAKGRAHGSPSADSSGPAPVRGGGPASGAAIPIAVAPAGPRGIHGGEQPVNPPADRPGPAAVDAKADPNFGPYMADLQRRIKRAWFPPKAGVTKRVVVTFRLHTRGELSNLAISGSSGMADADRAALKAVEDAAPFAHLPAGAPEFVDIQFTFDYNVFSGGGQGTYRRF